MLRSTHKKVLPKFESNGTSLYFPKIIHAGERNLQKCFQLQRWLTKRSSRIKKQESFPHWIELKHDFLLARKAKARGNTANNTWPVL